MGDGSCLGDGVICYSVDKVSIGPGAVVSQRAHLCSAGHDINDSRFPLVSAPITLGSKSWVCAEAFVGAGVRVGLGAVVAARAVVVRDVPDWTVWAGNPATKVSARSDKT